MPSIKHASINNEYWLRPAKAEKGEKNDQSKDANIFSFYPVWLPSHYFHDKLFVIWKGLKVLTAQKRNLKPNVQPCEPSWSLLSCSPPRTCAPWLLSYILVTLSLAYSFSPPTFLSSLQTSHLTSSISSIEKSWFCSQHCKPGVVAQTCKPSTWETEAEDQN